MEELPGKAEDHRTTFIEAWEATGRQSFDGDPYISRDLLRNYLIEEKGMSFEAVKKALSSGEYRMIGSLLEAKIIEARGAGWAVIDDATYTYMMLRNEEQ